MAKDIEEYLKAKAPLIDREIEKFFPKKLTEEWLEKALGKARYGYDVESIGKCVAEPIWDLLERGGKRWRPALMLLCAEAVGGKEEKVREFVVLPELIHNSTLIEDDIEDSSELRRGKPCTYKIFGLDVSVNAGSMMYVIPLVLLFGKGAKMDGKTKAGVYDLVMQEILRVHTGQATDICWHRGGKKEINEKEYLQMCINKTGCLARLSCRLGAMLGKGSREQIEALGRFGESIGVGFQIQDDILNLAGEEFAKGKGRGEDIHEGKRTLMVIHVMEKGSKEDRERLLEILNSHPSDEKTIEEAIAIINKYRAIEYAGERAKEIVKDAWKGVEGKIPESMAKGTLKAFADYLIERKI